MDSLFFLTISVIFISALVGVYTRRRSRDACLKDFAGYQVTVELKDGRLIWGRLEVFSSGIELVYRRPHTDQSGHTETSFVMYSSELSSIQAIYRYHDELAPSRQHQRHRALQTTYRRSLKQRVARSLRNFFNTFRDAFNQSLGVAMSQLKAGPGAQVLKAQNKNLVAMGDQVLGSVANAYEPILERYIGHRVVVEELRGEARLEHPGVLREYTGGWLELLDTRHQVEHAFDLSNPTRLRLNRDLDFILSRVDGKPSQLLLQVENHGQESVILKRVEADGWSEPLDALLPAGGSVDVPLAGLPATALEGVDVEALPPALALRAPHRPAPPQPAEGAGAHEVAISPDVPPPLPKVSLFVEAAREVDLCLPRSHATLRHGGEKARH